VPGGLHNKKEVYGFFIVLLTRFFIEQRWEYKENKERRQTFFNQKHIF
jgi:hypothetical protein